MKWRFKSYAGVYGSDRVGEGVEKERLEGWERKVGTACGARRKWIGSNQRKERRAVRARIVMGAVHTGMFLYYS